MWCSARRRNFTASWPIGEQRGIGRRSQRLHPAQIAIRHVRPGSQFGREARRPIRPLVGGRHMPALRFPQLLHRAQAPCGSGRSVHGPPSSPAQQPPQSVQRHDRRGIVAAFFFEDRQACRSIRAGPCAPRSARAARRGSPAAAPTAPPPDCRCPPSKRSGDSAARAFCVSYQLSRCPS